MFERKLGKNNNNNKSHYKIFYLLYVCIVHALFYLLCQKKYFVGKLKIFSESFI